MRRILIPDVGHCSYLLDFLLYRKKLIALTYLITLFPSGSPNRGRHITALLRRPKAQIIIIGRIIKAGIGPA